MLFKAKPVAVETENPSMAKPKSNHERQPDDEKGSPPDAAAWGTWEELLLAYAVNRFGTNSWDSISSELRKRSSAAKVFTPKHCKQKYLELERRFDGSIGDDDTTTAVAVPWIEQLRKLRVEELQRKLQNFDIYISSLQLKVKKLTDESTENGCGERKKKPGLGQKIDDIAIENVEEVNNKRRNPVKSGDEQVPGGDERDNQSVNGSNGNLETGENEFSPVNTADEKPESSPIGVEDSCDDRPDSREPVKTEPESIAESKSEGTVKENSDVQSSASKSRKERSDRVRRGSSKVDEREDEDQPNDSIPLRSLPLVDVLQKVHVLGSAVFERRLDRQEKARYKKLIREHIDFEILQTRLKQGWYSDGNNNFFRDLLLLVNNTFVFFSNESPEFVAAIELRQFILNKMTSNTQQKTDSKSKPTTLSPKRALEPPDSMPFKPKLAGSIIVCRKRSSIAAKPSGRKEQTDVMNSFDKKETATKRISDGFPPISKKTGKNIGGGNDVLESHSSGSENSDVKSDTKKMKNKKPVETEEKKRSAAKLLNRMNPSSSAANNVAIGIAARGGFEDDWGGEQKRGGEGKKDQLQALKRSSGGWQPDSPTNWSVGRPPKKAAAQPPAVAALGKRNRERAESEPSVSKQAKKRSKRL
ncbi:hypothetical protein L6452_37437 [Arctium lappa]|uniref:Uncharacterized protein n=1 Tax=Arctium lappa TaxID=4217 RepID=A0ACB8Y3H4_ARCLA|nr:hypothetical protein L6452_37437 [Arctium lappa]